MNENFDKRLVFMITDELLSFGKDELISAIREMDIRQRYLLLSLCAEVITRAKTGGESEDE
jgi:hypothetical protein